MKITAVQAIPVLGPRKQVYAKPYHTALGVNFQSEHAIVFIETDEGITGIGEISSVFSRRGILLAQDVQHVLAHVLLGADPFQITHLLKEMEHVLANATLAIAGLEMALYDIIGKALHTPVYNLIGGKVRDTIPLSFSLPFGEAEEMAEKAQEYVQAGFRTLKIKVGREPEVDLKAVKAVREAVGENVILRVDANMAWKTAKEAIRMIQAMEPYQLEMVEQPIHPKDLTGLAFIRKQVGVPIMVDESVWTPEEAMAVIKQEAADIVNVYVSEAGGLSNARHIFAMCEAAHIPCIIGSMPEFGIGTAACAHLGVAMPNLGYASDVCGFLYHAEDLIQETFRLENGYIWPPEGPGLGISVNPEVLERWRIK